MNDRPQSEPVDPQLQKLKMIADRMTDEDFDRVDPPAQMWSGIAAKMDRPASEVVVPRQARRRAWLGVAAAVAASLVIVSGLLVSGSDRDTVVASVPLTNEGLSPLGSESSGKARIVERGPSFLLRLDVSSPPEEPESYIEVWLIDSQVQGMISLGPFRGNGDYPIPSGVDPAKYPIVDISIEPSDGVPTHSGVSILRGVAAAQ
jgi:anti-sigma-K factor RskA